MRFLAVLTVRNEAAFLLEWLAHHKAVGFTDFLVFSNDCEDGTDAMLDRLQEIGLLTHLRNPGPHEGGVQFTALKAADKHPLVRQADWIMTFDIDEFVKIHVGDHTLPALLSALPDATAITLTWRLFGNDGVVRYQDRPITEQFTRAAPRILNWPWRAAMFKTLYRNDATYRKLGVHRPRSPDDGKLPAARWFDSHGRRLDDSFLTQRVFSAFGRDNYGLAQLNHYALGAMESYILKRDRGRVNRAGQDTGMSYWTERNWCIEEDRTIAALAGGRDAQLAAWRGDPRLDALHKDAVQWRHDRFAQLMQQEPNRGLFARLLMTPPAQPIPAKDVELLYKFAQSTFGTPD
ncbi:MAG: glycosyltransferase family 2 protein [Paracoccaceae bacterium]